MIKVAAQHRIPVVPRGAGTGLSGGAVTIRGGIALQMTRMRRILEIDPVGQTALVEPGVVNQELSLAAPPHGLFYAPDPSSQKACTIGGNAAENSGGPHCLYYGVTTNHVLGMEVVLADGSVHWVSGDAPDRVGLDLCGVLVGSEGTLCAITKIKVRLLRMPPSVATLLAAFPTIETASHAVSAVIAQRHRAGGARDDGPGHGRRGRGALPRRLSDRRRRRAAGRGRRHRRVDARADGRDPRCARREPGLRDARGADASRARPAVGRPQGRHRRAGRIKPNYYLHDGVVPRSRLPQILSAVGEIGEHYKLPVANVFHAGDGNLHPNILFDLRDHGRPAPGRGRGRGDAARGRRARRRALRRARHRAREERLHALGLQPRRPRGDAAVKDALDPDGHAEPGQDLSRPQRASSRTCAGRTGLAVEAKWW